MNDRERDRHDEALDARLRGLLHGAADDQADVDHPADDVVDAYLEGRADAAQIRAVRRALQASAALREEVLTLAELRRDLAGDALRRDLAAVRVPADLRVAATQAAVRRRPRLVRLVWHPAAGYATAAVLAVVLALSAPHTGAPEHAVGAVTVPRHLVLRGDDEPVPEVILPATAVVDLVVVGDVAAPDLAYQGTLRRLDDRRIEAYVAMARRTEDGRLVLRVDRDLLRPDVAYAVVFTPRSSADRAAGRAAGADGDVVGRFRVAGSEK